MQHNQDATTAQVPHWHLRCMEDHKGTGREKGVRGHGRVGPYLRCHAGWRGQRRVREAVGGLGGVKMHSVQDREGSLSSIISLHRGRGKMEKQRCK